MPADAARVFEEVRGILAMEIPDAAKLLWIHLLDRQGANDAAWPTQAAIARDLGWSRRTVIRWLGWLAAQRRGVIALLTIRHSGRSCRYRVCSARTWLAASRVERPGRGPPAATCDTAVTGLLSTCDTAVTSDVTTAARHKDERPIERPTPSLALGGRAGEPAREPPEITRGQGFPKRPRPSRGDPRAAALLEAWQAAYEAAKGFPPVVVRGRDTAILGGLLGTFSEAQVRQAIGAMLAHPYFAPRAHLVLLRDHFGELLEAAARAAPAKPARPDGTADAAAQREALVGSMFRASLRVLPPAQRSYRTQLCLVGAIRDLIAEAWAHGGEPLAQPWAAQWLHVLEAAIATGEARPITAARAAMDAWRAERRLAHVHQEPLARTAADRTSGTGVQP